MTNKFIRLLLERNVFDEDFTIDDIKRIIQADYEDCVDLRNRIANGTDEETIIYEEDHLILDRILDYLEILMKIGDL